MDFGIGPYRTFRFVPAFGGNRDTDPEHQVSCEIVRPTVAQRLAHDGETEAQLYAWRDEHMASWIDHPEYGEAITAMGPAVLTVLRTVATYSRDWRGVTLDGRPLTDTLEICLNAPIPEPGQRAIVREVYDAIQRASALTGSELGNFASQCGGRPGATTLRPTGEPTATTAAVLDPTGPAATPAAPTV
jgi:hypothetical protein